MLKFDSSINGSIRHSKLVECTVVMDTADPKKIRITKPAGLKTTFMLSFFYTSELLQAFLLPKLLIFQKELGGQPKATLLYYFLCLNLPSLVTRGLWRLLKSLTLSRLLQLNRLRVLPAAKHARLDWVYFAEIFQKHSLRLE